MEGHVEISRFFYKLYLVGQGLPAPRFLGTSFPVAPDGSLLTCRHVVDIQVPEGQSIAVLDAEASKFSPIGVPVYSPDTAIDLAYLRNALARGKAEFFPILSPPVLMVGFDIYSFGFFAIGGAASTVESGYFAGKIVNFFDHDVAPDKAKVTLPFPVLEGMSGSPVLTYHNGPKLVGIAIGNRNSRILASEVIEYKDERVELRETVNRIVEYGVAYHCSAVVQFLVRIGVQGWVASDSRTEIPNLE
jgi:trypsin-like peptidase